jgi:PIN domain nuclease of toxin-antitoxin system
VGGREVKLLLDTHIWLWSLREPTRLGRHLRHELRNPDNELWLSPISTWEALVLHAKRRIQLYDNPALWVRDATADFKEAPLTHEIALAVHKLNLPHADFADRFLAATAQVLGLTLVTADERLLGLGNIATLANR